VNNADIVELSFVRSADDVEDLLTTLDALGDTRLGIVVKIETVQGFRNLPTILLTAMRRPHTGVMIARGDLAVECGYARLAELQEEILWLCRNHRCRNGWPGRMRHAQQGTAHPGRGGRPRRHSAAHE
jgi:pyruvate kinase